MRRIAMVSLAMLMGLAAAADQRVSKGEYEIFVNGINKGRERYREDVDKKKGYRILTSDLFYKMPYQEAKRGYLDVYFYPTHTRDLNTGEFLEYQYHVKVNDFSQTDIAEADQSAMEVADQYREVFDYTEAVTNMTEDVMRGKIDFGVNAGGVRKAGGTFHFSHIKYNFSRVKDEKSQGLTAALDPMSACSFMPLVDLLQGEGPTWEIWFAIPQYMRYRPGRVESLGVVECPVNGKPYLLKQYDIFVQTGHYATMWVDKAGRLIRFSVPKDGFHSVLVDYTPQPFDKAAPRVITQTIEAPSSFRESRVTVASGAVRLGATLTLPDGPGPFPTALLVQEVGQGDRDGNLPGSTSAGPVRQAAYALAERGVASLRYDNRGRGESTGNAEEVTPKDRQSDIVALAGWLASNPAVKPGASYAISIGLGGWLVLEAQPTARFAGMVLVAYPGKPVLRLLKEQASSLEDATEMARDLKNLENLEAEMASEKAWAEFRGAKTYLPALRQLAAMDPLALLKAQTVPLLLAYPENDRVVQPFHSDIVAKALPPQAEVRQLKGMDHSLVKPAPQRAVSGVVNREVVWEVADWVLAKASPAP